MGRWIFKVVFNPNILTAFIFLILSITSFSSIGIISASFIMVFKRGDPFTWAFSTLSSLLGGVIYPVKVLPAGLQKIAFFLPITHVLEGMRMALLQGLSLMDLWPSFFYLVLFTFLMLPFSTWLFKKAVEKAKRDGTLTHY